ncbi:hypothetical protein [Nocardia sp. NPDC004722]
MGKVGIRAAISRRQQQELDRIYAAANREAATQLAQRIDSHVRMGHEALARGDHRAARAHADAAQAGVFVRAMTAGGVELS